MFNFKIILKKTSKRVSFFYYMYMGYVYLIEDIYNNTYKIGVAKDIDKRMKSLQTGNVCQLKLVCSFKTDYPYRLESMMHRSLSQYQELNEWYSLPKDIVFDFQSKCWQMNQIIISLKDNPYFAKNLK